jgi:glutamate synthase (NADPH/NADH) small chain
LAELERDFQAIFLGVGLGKVQMLGVPGEELPEVVDALDFIAQLKVDRPRARVGRRVVVVGGGNTAIDAVTQAARLGAEEVWMVYRRGPREMPAYHHEQELARQAGARFVWNAQPTRVAGEGRVQALHLQRLAADGEGRAAKLAPVAGSDFEIGCDMVIRANGQSARALFLQSLPGVKLERGRPAVDASMQTTNPRYFAGGDCISGGKEVVNAVAEGKIAAQGIHRYLSSKGAA